MANVTETYVLGTTVPLLTTEMNSLGSSTTYAISTATNGTIEIAGLFNNTYGGGGLGGYPMGRFQLVIGTPGGTLTANTSWNIWFIQSCDGITFEDGSASVLPTRSPDVVIPAAAATAQKPGVIIAPLPPGNWYVLIQNATGQTMAASGNILKVTPFAYQAG